MVFSLAGSALQFGISFANSFYPMGWLVYHSQVPRLSQMIVGEPNHSRAGNFSSAVASIAILHCSPPCDSSMPPAVCQKELLHWQTLRKSIQEVARANLAAPLDCPLSKTIQFPLDLFQNLTSISLLGDFTFFSASFL